MSLASRLSPLAPLVPLLAALVLGAPALRAAQDGTAPKLPGPAPSGDVMPPAAFRAWVAGRTLYFSEQGRPYGAEQYLPGDRAIWQFADGSCTRGRWYARGQALCFVYEGDPEEQCWIVLEDGPRVRVLSLGKGRRTELEVTWQDRRPLNCTAPDPGS